MTDARTPGSFAQASRSVIDLDGPWTVLIDDEDVGITEHWFEDFPASGRSRVFEVEIPSILQTYLPDMHGGIAWYTRTVDVPADWVGRSVRLRVGAADYRTVAWWGSQRIGDHEGGFSPFEFELDAVVPGPNRLTIRVSDVGRDYRRDYHGLPGWDHPTTKRIDGFTFSEIPSGHQDWKEGFEFSGIWQHVELVSVAKTSIEDVFVLPDWRRGTIAVRTSVRRDLSSSELTLAASVRPWRGDNVVGTASTALEPAGSDTPGLTISIEAPRLWSVIDPYLYVVEVTLSSDGRVIDRVEERFGLREFTVGDDGFFQLNGERIYIKGAHYQSTEPMTLAYPKDVAMARRIVALAKEGGFNFMRLQLRPTVPAILDAADELGILCMSEPPLSKMRDSERAKTLGIRETEELVRRDRNRPCIAIWLMANEQPAAMNVVKEMCDAARTIDPTRLIMESAGGPSHYYRPGESIGVSYLSEHYFQGQPANEGLMPYMLDRGIQGQLFFVTEFAVTGLVDDQALLDAYGPHANAQMEDYRGFVRHRDDLAETFESTGRNEVFGSLTDFRQATLDFQATSVALQVSAMRSNPRLGGYNIVQLADSNANEWSGLVDFWRAEKKPAFERIKAINEPLNLFVQPLPFNPRAGHPFRLAVTLVDEARVVERGQLVIVATTADGVARTLLEKEVSPDAWIDRLFDDAVTVEAPSGPMTIRAEIRSGGRAIIAGEGRADLYAPSDAPWPSAGFRLFDPQHRWPAGHDPLPWGARPGTDHSAVAAPELIVVPAVEALWRDRAAFEALVELAEQTRRGSTLVFLGIPDDGVPPHGLFRFDLTDAYHPLSLGTVLGFGFRDTEPGELWGGAVGSAYAWSVGETDAGGIITDHPIYRDLPGPGLMDWQYAGIMPSQSIDIRRRTVESTGTGIKMVRAGSGRIVFCTFRLLRGFGRDGLAERLFANLLDYLAPSLPPTFRSLTDREQSDRAFHTQQVADCYRLIEALGD